MKEYEVVGYDGEGAFRFFVGVCFFLLVIGFRAFSNLEELTPDDSTSKSPKKIVLIESGAKSLLTRCCTSAGGTWSSNTD